MILFYKIKNNSKEDGRMPYFDTSWANSASQ